MKRNTINQTFFTAFLYLVCSSALSAPLFESFHKKKAENKYEQLKSQNQNVKLTKIKKGVRVYHIRSKYYLKKKQAQLLRSRLRRAGFKRLQLIPYKSRVYVRAGAYYNRLALKKALRKVRRFTSFKFKGRLEIKQFPYYVITKDTGVFSATRNFFEGLADNIDSKISLNADYYPRYENKNWTSNPLILTHWDHDLSKNWSSRMGFRYDFISQPEAKDSTKSIIDIGDLYAKYERDSFVSTTGFQLVRWSRFDEFSLLDQLTRPDFERFLISDIDRRQRSQLLQRFEFFTKNFKSDLVLLPGSGAIQLPDADSRWSVVQKDTGHIIGGEPNDTLRQVLQSASINDDQDDAEDEFGFALRNTYIGENYDIGLTHFDIPSPTPYFQLDETVRGLLLIGTPPATAVQSGGSPTFLLIRPNVKMWAIDAVTTYDTYTFRLESLVQQDIPAMNKFFKTIFVENYQTSLGVEAFPGDGELRIDFRLSTQNLKSKESILGEKETYYSSGVVEYTWPVWKLSLAYNIGLNIEDYILNPELQYSGQDNYTYKLKAFHFDGSEKSIGGFYEEESFIGFEVLMTL